MGKGPRDLLIRIEVKHLCGKATTSALVVKSDAGYANEHGYQFEVQVRDKSRALVQYAPTAAFPRRIPKGSATTWIMTGEERNATSALAASI